MPTYSLDGDDSGLPRTKRSKIPYEVEALTPMETWGAGSGTTSIICKVRWDDSVDFIKDMVGEVRVVAKSAGQLALRREVPEVLRYNDGGSGTDTRIQFCTTIQQHSQGGNSAGANMAQAISKWPEVDWVKYKVTYEALSFAILDDGKSIGSLPSMADIVSATGSYAGARELYRYVIRKRRSYTKEQPTPGSSSAGGIFRGFKVVNDADPTKRGVVPGAVLFRNIQYADITIRWLRVPVGWPPPIDYFATDLSNPWPPKFNPVAPDPTTISRARDRFQGSVNSDWFDCAAPDGLCCPPETLLYTGFSDDNKYYDAAGDWVCDMDFFFRFKGGADATGDVRGWNHYLSSSGRWVAITSNTVLDPPDNLAGTSGGTKPYKTNDFNKLFDYSG